jgi:hypothetical protein
LKRQNKACRHAKESNAGSELEPELRLAGQVGSLKSRIFKHKRIALAVGKKQVEVRVKKCNQTMKLCECWGELKPLKVEMVQPIISASQRGKLS